MIAAVMAGSGSLSIVAVPLIALIDSRPEQLTACWLLVMGEEPWHSP